MTKELAVKLFWFELFTPIPLMLFALWFGETLAFSGDPMSRAGGGGMRPWSRNTS